GGSQVQALVGHWTWHGPAPWCLLSTAPRWPPGCCNRSSGSHARPGHAFRATESLQLSRHILVRQERAMIQEERPHAVDLHIRMRESQVDRADNAAFLLRRLRVVSPHQASVPDDPALC